MRDVGLVGVGIVFGWLTSKTWSDPGCQVCGLSSAPLLHRGSAGKTVGLAPGPAMTYSLVLSLLLAIVGVVLWIEGGPHPRTWAARLLLVAILLIAALPALICWLFC